MDVFVFGQQLGKVGGIASEVALLIQEHNALFKRIGQGMSGLTAPIPMCDRLCTSEAIFGLKPIRLPNTDAKNARNILFRETAIDPFFKNHSAFQFALRQGDLLLAHTDIFSDQLHPDNITEQRHSPMKKFCNAACFFV
jgi:hypothetical protein